LKHPSVIILQIDIDSILTIELKCDAPVTRYRDRIFAFAITLERMKFVSGQTHIIRLFRSVQAIKNALDSGSKLGGDILVAALGKEQL